MPLTSTYHSPRNRTLFDNSLSDAVDTPSQELDPYDEDEDEYEEDVDEPPEDEDIAGGNVNRPVAETRRFKSRAAVVEAHKARAIPELREEDLKEMFVRGSGPGGQATHKVNHLQLRCRSLLNRSCTSDIQRCLVESQAYWNTSDLPQDKIPSYESAHCQEDAFSKGKYC